MKPIPDDYEPEYEKFPAGKYKATGIVWTSLDNRENPVLVTQNDRMVGRLSFTIAGYEEGPPMSLTVGEMALLVKAFGADIEKLPPMPSLDKPGTVSKYMRGVEELINAANKEVDIEVSDKGWVNADSVGGMNVVGYIYFDYDDILPNEETGEIEPIAGEWGDYFITRWKVAGGEGGGPSPFTGATFLETFTYAIISNEENKVDWARTSSGGYSWPAVALSRMMTLTAPSMFEEGREPENPKNLLPEWDRLAKRQMQRLKGQRAKTKKGKIRMDWPNVEPVFDIPKPTIVPTQTAVSDRDVEARGLLRPLLDALAGTNAFEGNTWDLTMAGTEAARTHLAPLKTRGVIPHGRIPELTAEEVMAIFENIDVPIEQKDLVMQLTEKLGGQPTRRDSF